MPYQPGGGMGGYGRGHRRRGGGQGGQPLSRVPIFLVDTNVLLRFFLNDHPEHGEAAKRLIEQAVTDKVTLEIPLITIFETVFTLGRVYKQPRTRIADELSAFLSGKGIRLSGPAWIVNALKLYGNTR